MDFDSNWIKECNMRFKKKEKDFLMQINAQANSFISRYESGADTYIFIYLPQVIIDCYKQKRTLTKRVVL